MFHKVKSVNVFDKDKLIVQFIEGITKIYDVSNLIKKYESFKTLKDNQMLFNSVTVDKGGYGIIWNEEIDISSNELFNNGIDECNFEKK